MKVMVIDMTTEYEVLQENLTKLRLSNIRTNLTSLLDSEKLQDVSLTKALQILTTFELQSRKQNVRQQRIKRAHFPYLKTFEDFDFSYQSSLDKQQILELNTLRFMKEHKNLILIGTPDVGKTHIATSLGLQAIMKDQDVIFSTAQQMIQHLKTVEKRGTLGAALKKFRKVPLLILDEIDFMPMDDASANFFFQVINERYEKSSIIVTTNLPLSRWAEFIPDAQTNAILDRLVHHLVRIQISGKSYRMMDYYRNQT